MWSQDIGYEVNPKTASATQRFLPFRQTGSIAYFHLTLYAKLFFSVNKILFKRIFFIVSEFFAICHEDCAHIDGFTQKSLAAPFFTWVVNSKASFGTLSSLRADQCR
jgi:hypothetical protein